MRNYVVVIIASLCFSGYVFGANNPVKFRRICNDPVPGSTNIFLFWYPTTDTCSSFQKYYIWARNGTSGPFFLIDSITNKAAETYTHVGANAGGGSKNWFYFIQNTDSCGPVYIASSDTIPVDISQNYPTFIDSVSVDNITNKVIIGWNSNKAPDFYIYDAYRDNGNFNYTLIKSTRDTSLIDTLLDSDPSVKAIKYDLNTKDSCGNPGVFGVNPHRTIFLSLQKDTCKRQCTLSWSPYSFIENGVKYGWTKVRKYYIYKKINSSPITLIDSVDDTTPLSLSYADNINLGDTLLYFVRAIKDTSILVTSSSNYSSIITRLRIDPKHTYLQNVSVNPINNTPIYTNFYTN
jgi:hypothetical protein